MRVLIDAGANVNLAETTMGWTPLCVASENGNVDLVEVLIKAGANVNQASTTDGGTPLFVASQLLVKEDEVVYRLDDLGL